MQKILFRKTLRDLRGNWARYLALFLLTALCMFIVVGLVSSAYSISRTAAEHAAANNLEDGEFAVLAPLTYDQKAQIADLGVEIEEQFSIVAQMDDGSELRVMEVRDAINCLEAVEGSIPSEPGTVALEVLYARVHDIRPGDTVNINGNDYTVSGLVIAPDYESVMKSLGDLSRDSAAFGCVYVLGNDYSQIVASGTGVYGEDYRYAYKLGGTATNDNLKDLLRTFVVDATQVDNPFFQEAYALASRDRTQAESGIAQLKEGSSKLSSGLEQYSTGFTQFQELVQLIKTGSSTLSENSPGLLKAAETIRDEVGKSGDMIDKVQKANEQLTQALEGYENALYDMALAMIDVEWIEDNSSEPETIAHAQSAFRHIKDASDKYDKTASLIDQIKTSTAVVQRALDSYRKSFVAQAKQVEQFVNMVDKYTKGVGTLDSGLEQLSSSGNKLLGAAKTLEEGSMKLDEGVDIMRVRTMDVLDRYMTSDINTMYEFIPASANARIDAAAGSTSMRIILGIIAGIFGLLLLSYVISVFVVHSIDSDSQVIGALYALGVKRRQLLLSYASLPVLLCLAGGILGTLAALSGAANAFFTSDMMRMYSLPSFEFHPNALLLVYSLVLPPVAAFIVNMLVIRKKLNRSALSLLRNEAQVKEVKERQLPKSMGFVRMFQLRQFMREKRSSITIILGMVASLLLMMLGLTAYQFCVNLQEDAAEDTTYEYMYTLKYPMETPPEQGTRAYLSVLKGTTDLGRDLSVTVIGVDEGNPYFEFQESTKGNEIAISEALAQKFDLDVGDELELVDDFSDRSYSFTVTDKVHDRYSISAYMNRKTMAKLFGRTQSYYNTLYSSEPLDISAGRLNSVVTRNDILGRTTMLMNGMMSIVIMLVSTSILVFLVVLYQMLKVMIDRSTQSIALMRILGFSKREIRKLYLDGNLLAVAVGSAIAIPIVKLVVDLMFPLVLSQNALGMDLAWPWWMYVLLWLGVIIAYLAIRTALMRILNKLDPMEALKKRN